MRTPLLTFLCRETSKFHRFSRFFHHCERRYPVSLTLVVSFGDRLIVSSTGKVNFVFAEMFLCEDIEENLRKEDLFYCFSLYHFLAMSPPWWQFCSVNTLPFSKTCISVFLKTKTIKPSAMNLPLCFLLKYSRNAVLLDKHLLIFDWLNPWCLDNVVHFQDSWIW